MSFEEIASRIVATAEVFRVRVKPYDAPERGEPKDARQATFLLRADQQACDLLFNAPDGLRGRYWQSPDHGFLATKHLIGELIPILKAFAEAEAPPPFPGAAEMTVGDIVTSLAATSAKAWPREFDDDRNWLLRYDNLTIPRWAVAEEQAEINQGLWRQSQVTDELDIAYPCLTAASRNLVYIFSVSSAVVYDAKPFGPETMKGTLIVLITPAMSPWPYASK